MNACQEVPTCPGMFVCGKAISVYRIPSCEYFEKSKEIDEQCKFYWVESGPPPTDGKRFTWVRYRCENAEAQLCAKLEDI